MNNSGKTAIAYTVPNIWNNLPLGIKSSNPLSRLKTHLFSLS